MCLTVMSGVAASTDVNVCRVLMMLIAEHRGRCCQRLDCVLVGSELTVITGHKSGCFQRLDCVLLQSAIYV
jgi:hypothetical protein